jgi:thiol-disulfide isomerase/thioredoxin
MFHSMRAVLLAALILLVAAPAFAGEHQMSYADALAAAREHDTVVVIDFFADWCGPCKAFDRDLASQESGISEALGAVVFTSIDAEKGDGVELAKKYGVTGFPTYAMMTAEGELIESWVGYGGPAHFLGALETALADPITFAEKKERFAAEPTAEAAKNIGRIASASGEHAESMEFLAKAEELDPEFDVTNELLDAAFGRARKDPDYSKADYIALAQERVLERDAPAEATLMSTYYVGRFTADEEDHTTLKPFLVKSREVIASSDEELSQSLVNAIELQAIMYVDGDMDAAVVRKRSTMREGWMEDPDQLNAFAWWCFENNVILAEAQDLALKGVELAEPGKARAQVLDTAAEICNALGDCGQAIELIQLAIAEDADNEYYTEQLARFEKIQAHLKQS